MYLFIKHLLKVCYMLGIVVDIGNIMMNKSEMILAFKQLIIHIRKIAITNFK